MADNVIVQEAVSGSNIAADEVSRNAVSEKQQIIKMSLGAEGQFDTLLDSGRQTEANSLPVVIAANPVSTANSTTANLAANVTFTGTSEEVKDYALIQVSIYSSHASATNGLSLQQSMDNTNWDIVDTYTIPATTGKVFSIQPVARYYRLVYTNGATLTTSLRIQTIYHAIPSKSSSERPNDAVSNENDFEQILTYQMLYNGTTWDRQRGDITNGLDVDVTRVIPGTTATSLGKAEDAAHVSGDTGISMLGVRNDTQSAPTSTDGDYGYPSLSREGELLIQQRSRTPAQTSVAGSATSVSLLAANNNRKGATIVNESSAVLYIKLGATASTTSYSVVLAGAASAPYAYYEIPFGYTQAIDGIWASATGNARITELT